MKCWLWLLVALLIIVSSCVVMVIKKKYDEQFTINDYYSKYYQDMAVPQEFYSSNLGALPKQHYVAEVNDRFVMDTLNKYKVVDGEGYAKGNTIFFMKENVKQQLLKKINMFLTSALNGGLSSDEKFYFANVFSQIQKVSRESLEVVVIESNHLVYRDTKLYGISISLVTRFNMRTNKISLLTYKLNGYVFEDKISNLTPMNLFDNNYQAFMQSPKIRQDSKYENAYLCKYYDDVQKFTGYKVNHDLKCK